MKSYPKIWQFLCLVLSLCVLMTACSTTETSEAADSGDTAVAQQSADTGKLGTGLIMGSVSSQLDENPNRAIRRSVTPIPEAKGTLLNGAEFPSNYFLYRNLLDSNGQKAYDQIRAAILKGANSVSLTVPIPVDDMSRVYQYVVFDSADVFWAETSMSYNYNSYGYVTTLYPGYNDLVSNISGNAQTMENAVKNALSTMWTLGSDVEKAKYAHDYLTNTIDYVSNSPYNQSAYSALVYGQTVCAGYAHAFQYMMQKMGIPCAYIVGMAGEYHAWNVVFLDGQYYAMDVTWDDPLGSGPTDYIYTYFNITDYQIAADHTRDALSVGIPVAEGTAGSYQNAFGNNKPGTDFGLGGNGNGLEEIPPEEEAAPEEDYTEPEIFEEDTAPKDDEEYYEDEDDYAEEDNSAEEFEWWSALDDSWTMDDWSFEDELWQIWDEETGVWYFYDEAEESFGCMDEDGETFYILDDESGEWVAVE